MKDAKLFLRCHNHCRIIQLTNKIEPSEINSALTHLVSSVITVLVGIVLYLGSSITSFLVPGFGAVPYLLISVGTCRYDVDVFSIVLLTVREGVGGPVDVVVVVIMVPGAAGTSSLSIWLSSSVGSSQRLHGNTCFSLREGTSTVTWSSFQPAARPLLSCPIRSF